MYDENKNYQYAILVDKPYISEENTKNFYRSNRGNFSSWSNELNEAFTYKTFDEAWGVLNNYFKNLFPRYVVKITNIKDREYEIVKGITV